MSSVAIIPARGGSKGVPLKNIRVINGEPLLGYTVTAAKESGVFDRIIVSTDSEDISEVAKKLGVDVPFIRPKNISGDLASSDSVIVHAINYLKSVGEEYDVVCKLQPTSPLRTSKHIQEAYELLCHKEANFVVSFCECEHSPLWSGQLGKDYSIDFFMKNTDKGACRQELPTFYRLNGAIYFGKTEAFMQNGSFIGEKGFAYIMPQEDSVDIDSELDFALAELLLERKHQNEV